MPKRHFSAGGISDQTLRRWNIMVKPEDTSRLVELLNQHGYQHKFYHAGTEYNMHTVTGTSAAQMRPLFDSNQFIYACEWLDAPIGLF
jgi:hypothetical protein